MQICTGNPNQLWAYDSPMETDAGIINIMTVYSEAEILDSFYPSWSLGMIRIGKLPMITEYNCINDWIVCNWAYKPHE